jgi:uncharacterized repeat protein (TIGR01451 family)
MFAGCRTRKEGQARGPGKRTSGPRGVRAALLGVIAVALMTIAAPTASAAPFECDAFGYLFQTDSATPTVHDVFQVDLATGQYTAIPGGTPDALNAVAYNSVDDFFYAWDADTADVVRINDDLTLDHLGVPTGPGGPAAASHIGDIDPAGHYWMSNGANWWEIDLTTTPTPTVIDTGTLTAPAGLTMGADWGWINGSLYMVGFDSTTRQGHLLRFNPATGVLSDAGALAITINTGVGAVYVDASGYLYASDNGNGNIYRINTTTRQAIQVANGPSSTGNDGARCALAPIPTVTVTKTVDGRVRSADQFTVSLVKPDGTLGTSATTSGAATSASTTDFPASQGKTYTITDAMASGSPTPLAEYVKSIVCKDGSGNTVPVGGSAPSWTLNIATATNYTCNVTNKAQSDLKIEKSAEPSPAVPGTNETYSLKVTNNGPSTAINARVSDPLPSGLRFVSAGAGCAEANKTVTCTAASIAPGASQTFTVTAKIASSVDSCDQLRNKATVTSDVFDPDTSNNASEICPQFEGRSDLSMTKTASQTQVTPGGQVMYTLVVKNDGPSDDTGVRVTDPMAQGLTLVAAKPSQGSCSTAGGQVTCDLGTLKADGSAQVLVTAHVGSTLGNVTNTACVSGDKKDPDSKGNCASSTITIVPGPEPKFDLSVSKKANHNTVYVGQPTTYTIVVSNKGPDAAPNVKVTDTFSVPASVVSVKTTQGSCTDEIPITCKLGTVKAGGKVTITVVLKPKRSGKARNAASATGDGTDGDPSNNMARTTTTVKSVALRLSKAADHASARAGERMGYTIRVTNPTRGEARDVQVCDRMPSGMVYVSSKARAKYTKGQYCWHIDTLRARSSRSYRITVRMLASASGSKVNRATASGEGATTKRAKDPVHVLPARASGGGGGVTG